MRIVDRIQIEAKARHDFLDMLTNKGLELGEVAYYYQTIFDILKEYVDVSNKTVKELAERNVIDTPFQSS